MYLTLCNLVYWNKVVKMVSLVQQRNTLFNSKANKLESTHATWNEKLIQRIYYIFCVVSSLVTYLVRCTGFAKYLKNELKTHKTTPLVAAVYRNAKFQLTGTSIKSILSQARQLFFSYSETCILVILLFYIFPEMVVNIFFHCLQPDSHSTLVCRVAEHWQNSSKGVVVWTKWLYKFFSLLFFVKVSPVYCHRFRRYYLHKTAPTILLVIVVSPVFA